MISYSFSLCFNIFVFTIFLYLLFMRVMENAEQGLESVFRQYCPLVDSKQNTAANRVFPITKIIILLLLL